MLLYSGQNGYIKSEKTRTHFRTVCGRLLPYPEESCPAGKSEPNMKIVWVMVVLVFADGEWRDWNTYSRIEECLEVVQVITYRREDVLMAVCQPREKRD